MDRQIITFEVDEQNLVKSGGLSRYSSNKVAYIEAHFDLGDNWDGFDVVRAIWFTDFVTGIATVLDSEGICVVPQEVLRRKGLVNVNLVGSISDDGVITDRLTSYPVVGLVVDANAKTDGTETAELTPSQIEQFAHNVKEDADRAEAAKEDARGYAADAAQSAEEAEEWADAAEQAAANAGYMFFHIDDDPASGTYGHLIYERTSNTEVDFYLSNGHLFVEAIA